MLIWPDPCIIHMFIYSFRKNQPFMEVSIPLRMDPMGYDISVEKTSIYSLTQKCIPWFFQGVKHMCFFSLYCLTRVFDVGRHWMARVCWTSRHRSRFAMLVRSIQKGHQWSEWNHGMMKSPRVGSRISWFPPFLSIFEGYLLQVFRVKGMEKWWWNFNSSQWNWRFLQDQKPGCNLYVTGGDRLGRFVGDHLKQLMDSVAPTAARLTLNNQGNGTSGHLAVMVCELNGSLQDFERLVTKNYWRWWTEHDEHGELVYIKIISCHGEMTLSCQLSWLHVSTQRSRHQLSALPLRCLTSSIHTMLSSMKLVIFSYLWLMVSSRELPPAMADLVEAYVAAQKGEKDDLRVAAMSLRKALKDESEEVKMAVLEALKLPTDLINDVTSRPETPVTWFLDISWEVYGRSRWKCRFFNRFGMRVLLVHVCLCYQ